MKTPILVPQVNANDTHLTFVSRDVDQGQTVTAGTVIAALESSKATVEVEAPADGILHWHIRESERVLVGSLLAEIYHESGGYEQVRQREHKATERQSALPNRSQKAGVRRFSKSALDYLKEHGLKESDFPGEGLINLLRLQTWHETHVLSQPNAGSDGVGRNLDPMMKRLARTNKSALISSLTVTFDSQRFMEAVQKSDHAHFLPILLNVLGKRLMLPENADFMAYVLNGKILNHDSLKLGIAMDLGKGLRQPVFEHPDAATIADIADFLNQALTAYQEDRIDSMEGQASFTVSNLYDLGISHFQPVLNIDHSAVLGIGGQPDKPENPMSLTLVFDHRILNGLAVANFLNGLRDDLLSWDPSELQARWLNKGLSQRYLPGVYEEAICVGDRLKLRCGYTRLRNCESLDDARAFMPIIRQQRNRLGLLVMPWDFVGQSCFGELVEGFQPQAPHRLRILFLGQGNEQRRLFEGQILQDSRFDPGLYACQFLDLEAASDPQNALNQEVRHISADAFVRWSGNQRQVFGMEPKPQRVHLWIHGDSADAVQASHLPIVDDLGHPISVQVHYGPLTANQEARQEMARPIYARKSCPQPGRYETYHPPKRQASSDMEKALAQIWQSLLSVNEVSCEDHFFQLGGHSMAAAQLVFQVQQRFGIKPQLQDIYQTPTLEAMADRFNRLKPLEKKPARQTDPTCCSPAQEALYEWEHRQMDDPGYLSFYLPYRLNGPFAGGLLDEVLHEVLDRHPHLAQRVVLRDQQLRRDQRVKPLPVSYVDLQAVPEAEWETLLNDYLEATKVQALSPEAGHFLKLHLFKLGPQRHLLFVQIHRFVCDGYSIGLFLDELETAYQASLSQRPNRRPKPLAYGQAAMSAKQIMNRQHLQARVGNLLQRFEGLELGLTPAPDGGLLMRHDLKMSQVQRARLEFLAQSKKLSLFQFLFARFAYAYVEVDPQPQIICTPVLNRDLPGSEWTIGLFANMVPVLVEPTQSTFSESLPQILRQIEEAFDEKVVPFEALVAALDGDLSRNPMGRVCFLMHNEPERQQGSGPLQLLPIRRNRLPRFDIEVHVYDYAGEFKISLLARDSWRQSDLETLAQKFLG